MGFCPMGINEYPPISTIGNSPLSTSKADHVIILTYREEVLLHFCMGLKIQYSSC